MKHWNRLFVRHGWVLPEKTEKVFDCREETNENVDFLLECLDKASIPYVYGMQELILPTAAFSEKKWLEAVNFDGRGRGESLWFDATSDQPKVRELDTYICGIVRQLNRLGFHTAGSCDGHGQRPAHVMVTKDRPVEQLTTLFQALGQNRVRVREIRGRFRVTFHMSQMELLAVAEGLSAVRQDWLGEEKEVLDKYLFQHLVEDLLDIPGVSGREELVKDYITEKIAPHVDYITTDHAGNLLAEMTYKGGHGPVILLNAHMDTVFEFEPNREIVKDGHIWSSTKVILGADDRAGVAVLIHLAEVLPQSGFSGKVKFIFTVEEECGLVGASEVQDYFLWGVDAAIVVDRCGTGDIVTSCGGYVPYCSPQYGAFFEQVAHENGLAGWTVTAGGSSDTRIWAEQGIQSVNLSAGYDDEHTEREVLDVDACYGTFELLQAVFEDGRRLRGVLRDIRRGRRVAGRPGARRKVIAIDDGKYTVGRALEEAEVLEEKGHQIAFDLTKIKDRDRKVDIIMEMDSRE